jgi:hypothetical protein
MALYCRSYYRCTQSAEQGCPAKRMVQRNDDDDGGISGGGTPKYTVVYMTEHTCTANDSSMELLPPVILETATVPAANKTAADDTAGPAEAEARRHDGAAVDSASSPATTMSVVTTTGTAQSPATSDVTWSSTASNKEHAIIEDFLYEGLLDVDDRWKSSLLVQDDDFTGPIRSPVHIAADSCWTIDQQQYLQLHLVNEPIDHFSVDYSF